MENELVNYQCFSEAVYRFFVDEKETKTYTGKMIPCVEQSNDSAIAINIEISGTVKEVANKMLKNIVLICILLH